MTSYAGTKRVRNWCFTFNNPDGHLADWYDDHADRVVYLIYNEEVGATGNHHFQGFVHFNKVATEERGRCPANLRAGHTSHLASR